jgi:hypothetical protein
MIEYVEHLLAEELSISIEIDSDWIIFAWLSCEPESISFWLLISLDDFRLRKDSFVRLQVLIDDTFGVVIGGAIRDNDLILGVSLIIDGVESSNDLWVEGVIACAEDDADLFLG